MLKIVWFAAALALFAVPASAHGWMHHGMRHHHGFGGFHNGGGYYNGGEYYRGGVGGYYGGNNWGYVIQQTLPFIYGGGYRYGYSYRGGGNYRYGPYNYYYGGYGVPCYCYQRTWNGYGY